MNMEELLLLQRQWKAKGNPPCDHPDYEQEYSRPGGMHTGDYACTQYGACADPADFKGKRRPPFQG